MILLAIAPSSVYSSSFAIYIPSVFSLTIIKSRLSKRALVFGYDLTGLRFANRFNSCLSLTITSAAVSPAAPKRHASAFFASSIVSFGKASPFFSRHSSPASP